jgi:hypothetical protein
LLINRDCGGNEVVGDSNLFIFGKEDALVGLGPHMIEVLDVFLPLEISGGASGVEMINWIWHHHVRSKNLLIAAGHLQEAVPIICLKEKPMPRIFSDCKCLVDPYIDFVTSYLGIVNLPLKLRKDQASCTQQPDWETPMFLIKWCAPLFTKCCERPAPCIDVNQLTPPPPRFTIAIEARQQSDAAAGFALMQN